MRTVTVVRPFPNEASAWSAALRGDSDGYAAVFDGNLDRVYRHALRFARNPHDAEDLTAGAFAELWRRRKHVRVVDGSVLPWLLVTVTNLERNHARGLRRHRSLLAALPRGEASRSAGDVADEQVAADGAADSVRQALGRLGPSDAALIALTAFENLGPAQVAAALGISPGAARTRLHRARARMASELAASTEGGLGAVTMEDMR
ncbi:MAG: RNA polymerase sigma factor [Acidimicrobiales bacterium]